MLRHAACRLRRRGHYLHAAKETRTCLPLRELSLLRSAPHSIVTLSAIKYRLARLPSAHYTHQANTLLDPSDSQAFSTATRIPNPTTTNNQNKAINTKPPSHQAKAKSSTLRGRTHSPTLSSPSTNQATMGLMWTKGFGGKHAGKSGLLLRFFTTAHGYKHSRMPWRGHIISTITLLT
jgi:hypothetical protein